MQSTRFLHAKNVAQAALVASLAFSPALAVAQLKIVDPPRDALNQAQALFKLLDAGKYAEA